MTDGTIFDLVIVGGGPAGMAAAQAVSGHGLSIAIVDEQQRPGGQIGRQPPAAFEVRNWLGGPAYRAVRTQIAAFEALTEVTWLGGYSVIGQAREADGFVVHAVGPDGALRLRARRVLIAAGCYDLPVPRPGWTLPGVMAAGGVQAFIKSQQFVAGERFALAGTHPLMLVVAAQIVEAGGAVAVVAFDQPLGSPLRALVSRAVTAARHLAVLTAAASAIRVLRRYRVPIRFGQPLRAVLGEGEVMGARFGDGWEVGCDRVALCYGFVPQSDLPRLAGASGAWAAPAGGWLTHHDRWMETDCRGLFVAGETTGIGGAAIARAEGQLAGLGLLRSLRSLADQEAERMAISPRRQRERLGRFVGLLDAIADPSEALARPIAPETILCRCEDVTVGAVVAAMADGTTPNAIKLATRCGMGLCQGRSCEAALLRLGAAHDGSTVDALTRFTARFPVRPARIGDLVDPMSVAVAATKSPAAQD